MTKRKNRKAKKAKPKNKLPLLIIGGVLAGMSPAIDQARAGDFKGVLNTFTNHYLGYSISENRLNLSEAAKGWVPAILGIVGSKTIGKAVNQRVRIPFIKA